MVWRVFVKMLDLHRSGPLLVLALLGGLLATAAACSKRQQAPSPPFAWAKDNPTTTPIAPTTPPPPPNTCGEGCSTRGITVLPSEPNPEAVRLFVESLAQPGLAFAPASDPPRVTEAALKNTALGAAFAMKPAGSIQSAKLREGERASLPVTVAAGECVTYVAQGGLGTIEVDMFLTRPGSPPPRVLQQDTEPGPMAAIGRGECLRGDQDAALSAELHVRMRRGEGVVLLQRFQRESGEAAGGGSAR